LFYRGINAIKYLLIQITLIMTPQKLYSNHMYSYIHLRRAVGWIGILLPFVLVIGAYILVKEEAFQQSISHYYHSSMRDVFVGSLCAIALFMFFYSGYDKWDNLAGNIAGFAAIGIALFPTTESGTVDLVGKAHYFFAIVFFLTLSVFSLWLFRKGKKPEEQTPEKKKRNLVYLICGIIMVASLVAIPVYQNLFANGKENMFVFIGETIALLAFGFSWLVKGEAILKDQ